MLGTPTLEDDMDTHHDHDHDDIERPGDERRADDPNSENRDDHPVGTTTGTGAGATTGAVAGAAAPATRWPRRPTPKAMR
ncbi:MAG: hypothetical protein ACO1PW_09515 [Actinomycetota bacterium]